MGECGSSSIEAGTNVATEIGGIEYSGHALDMMQSDGITPSVVENAITQGIAGAGRDGAILYYDSANNITAVVSSSGRVITVYPGGS